MSQVGGNTTNVYSSAGLLGNLTNAGVGTFGYEAVLGSNRGTLGQQALVDAEGRQFNAPFNYTRLTTVGGGSTVAVSTIASTLSGGTFLFGGASSGQVFVIPDPQLGFYMRFIGVADASSVATIFQFSSRIKVQVANGATLSTGNAIQSTNINVEAGMSFELFGVASTLVLCVPGLNPATTLAAVATT